MAADGGKMLTQFEFDAPSLRADGTLIFTARKDGKEKRFVVDGRKVDRHLQGVAEAIGGAGLMRHMQYQVNADGFTSPFAATAWSARGDAAASIDLARDLQFVSAVAAMQPLSALTSMDALPMNVDQPKPYQTKYTYRNVTMTKGAGMSRNYDDLGRRVALSVTATDTPIVASIASASWNLADIARAQLGDLPLQAYQLMAVRRWVYEDVNSLNWFGDADQGVIGVYNNGSITKTSVANWATGGSGSTALAPDVILAQFRALFTRLATAIKQSDNTGVSLRPNALRLPTSAMLELTQPMSNVGGAPMGSWTILDAIKIAFAALAGGPIEVESSPELEDNGSGARWAFCYRKDSMVGGRLLPVDVSYLPPDIDSRLIAQTVHAQSGGYALRYPVSAQIIYGF
jgi:hypothetical protein